MLGAAVAGVMGESIGNGCATCVCSEDPSGIVMTSPCGLLSPCELSPGMPIVRASSWSLWCWKC
eukprot:8464825-Heterocapsa_arctica.AAC.1